MNYLLDAHVLLWATFEPNKLSPSVLVTADKKLERYPVTILWAQE